MFAAEGSFHPKATRAALGGFGSPVMVLAGEFDVGNPPQAMAEYAGLFPTSQLVLQPGAGHFPWLDDADLFVQATAAFLS